MNIFVLHKNPKLAAKFHCDKHVIKMIVESAQMLMSSYHVTQNEKALNHKDMYRLTHQKHPCTLWVNESLSNWKWLYELMNELNEEYKSRYDKSVDHLSVTKINNVVNEAGLPNIEGIGLTDFAQAMPEQYRCEDAVKAYREYYMGEKQNIAKWRNEIPDWFDISIKKKP